MLLRSGTESEAGEERIVGAHQGMGLWASWRRLSAVKSLVTWAALPASSCLTDFLHPGLSSHTQGLLKVYLPKANYRPVLNTCC